MTMIAQSDLKKGASVLSRMGPTIYLIATVLASIGWAWLIGSCGLALLGY